MLAVLMSVALVTRLSGLDAVGFAEDEMDKLHGAEAYRHGDFTLDGEHPALMKLAVAASLTMADVWNRAVSGSMQMSRETAVRIPNAIAGAAISIVLFLLAEHFFTPLVALIVAWLWTFDVSAIAMNRVAKEDTFALMFFLLGALLFERAKRIGRTAPRPAQRWFAAAGVMFGLMVASKYVPFLVGYHILYFRCAEPHPGSNRPDKSTYFGMMAAAFLIVNFPVLLPANWNTVLGFVSGRAQPHSGYMFQGHVWPNLMSAAWHGLPCWFYLAQFATKIPLPVLLAIAIGVWQLSWRRRERGAAFVGILLVLMIVPFSLVATKFLRYMLPTLALLDLTAAVGVDWLATRAAVLNSLPRRACAGLVAAIVLVAPVGAWAVAHPFPAIYRNALGEFLAPHQLWFPPDELYDAGLREAIGAIARTAPADTHVITEAPAVVSFYALANGRPDLRVERTDTSDGEDESWLVVQDGRIYLNNEGTIETARRHAPAFAVTLRGFRAVEVYRDK